MTYLDTNSTNEITKHYALNIFHSNVQSFKNKVDEIHLAITSHNYPQVLCFNEIWDPPKSILNIKGYQNPIIKSRTGKKGGGTCIHVKKGIKILKKNDFSNLNLKYLEAISVTLEMHNKNITIISIYRAPNKPPYKSLTELESLLDLYSNMSSTLILIGDLNFDTLNPSAAPAPVKAYLDLIEQFFLSQCVNSPTRITAKSKTLIDHVVTNKPDQLNVNTLLNAVADHQSVMTSLLTKNHSKNYTKAKEISTVLLADSISSIESNIDWPQTCEKISMLNSNEGMELLLELLKDNLVTKKIKPRNKNFIPKKKWMTPAALEMRKMKEAARKKFLKSQAPQDETNYKKLRKEYNELLKNLKDQYYHRKIYQAKGDGRKIWQTINEVLQREKKDPIEEISLKNDKNEITSDPVEVANIFNQFYINFAPDLAEKIPIPDITVDELISKAPIPEQKFSFRHMTTEEIKKIIQELPPKLSSGFDNISCKLTKGIKDCIAEPLMMILNKSFTEGNFPKSIKIGKIVTIFKDGNKNDPSCYRPISMLNSTSKIFEKASLSQIAPHLYKNDIINQKQFGFQKNSSTFHPLILTLDHIEKELNFGKYVLLIAIDLKKAFDTVDCKNILPKKLQHYQFDQNSINWISSFFNDREQFVVINGDKSDTKKLRDISVCQGASMGPDFFNIYINDLPYNTKFTTFLFADDTNLLYSDTNLKDLETKANFELDNVKKFMQANKLSLNLQKTNYMILKPKKPKIRQNEDICLKIGNHTISEVDEIKFLGIPIPKDLKFTGHYNNVINKMKSGLAALNMIKSVLPTRTKLQIFNSLIKPHYEYCSIIWSTKINKKQTQKIIKLQKQGLRLVYSANKLCHSSNLFLKSGITRFDLLFTKNTIELFHKKQLGIVPKLIKTTVDELCSSKNPRNNNLRIPSIYKKGDLMYELLNSWNNLPESIKTAPNKSFKSKKMISDFIKTKYEICQLKKCESCKVTWFENIMNPINELITVLR